MSQQINLFNPIFRKQGFSYTSATAMLYGVGIAVAISGLGAGFENYRLRAVQTQAHRVKSSWPKFSEALGGISTKVPRPSNLPAAAPGP